MSVSPNPFWSPRDSCCLAACVLGAQKAGHSRKGRARHVRRKGPGVGSTQQGTMLTRTEGKGVSLNDNNNKKATGDTWDGPGECSLSASR